jgi:hypothetical protein
MTIERPQTWIDFCCGVGLLLASALFVVFCLYEIFG